MEEVQGIGGKEEGKEDKGNGMEAGKGQRRVLGKENLEGGRRKGG